MSAKRIRTRPGSDRVGAGSAFPARGAAPAVESPHPAATCLDVDHKVVLISNTLESLLSRQGFEEPLQLFFRSEVDLDSSRVALAYDPDACSQHEMQAFFGGAR